MWYIQCSKSHEDGDVEAFAFGPYETEKEAKNIAQHLGDQLTELDYEMDIHHQQFQSVKSYIQEITEFSEE